MKRNLFLMGMVLAVSSVSAQSFTENFEDISSLSQSGWEMKNNSQPLGSIGWFQGNSAEFDAQAGPTNSYIAANFSSTANEGNISNWLFTPVRTFTNGDIIKFWTRVPTRIVAHWNDALDVRLSTNGNSINVGENATSVGDFTKILAQINPEKDFSYPDDWKEYSITLSGLSGPTTGRIAFRYWIESEPANYIGIDSFSYISKGLSAAENTISTSVKIYPNPANEELQIQTSSEITNVQVFDTSGRNINVDFKNKKADIRHLLSGTYLIKIGIKDKASEVLKFIKQ